MTALVVLARLGAQAVAFAADRVEAAVDLGEIVPVPLAPPHLRGLAAVRSQVLTVVDAGLAVQSAPAAGRRALVVVVDGHRYALLVDAVEEVTAPSAIHDAPADAALGEWRRAATALVEADGRVHLLLDPGRLVMGESLTSQ